MYKSQFNSIFLNQMVVSCSKKQLFLLQPLVRLKNDYLRIKKTVFFPYKILLKLNGLNFKIAVVANYVQLVLGYSHPVFIKLPRGLRIVIIDEKKNILLIESFNRNIVASFISLLYRLKPINNYTQIGFSKLKETIKLKIGKKK